MSVKFYTSEAKHLHDLKLNQCLLLFHGDALDPRGELAVNSWDGQCQRVQVKYDIDLMEISLGAYKDSADSIVDLLRNFDLSSIVIEATTLGFAELFLLISALVEIGVEEINIVYVEPENYTKTNAGAQSFALSDMSKGYQPIPRSIVDLSSDDMEAGVFFLGFEPERLDRALEEHQMITSKDVKVVFGMPAFHPGWELDSIIPHLHSVAMNHLVVDYCSANDPESAYECLERTLSSLGRGKNMFIAPIGPKPCGIASAVFASINAERVGLLYDHPQKSPKRSSGAFVWHEYKIVLATNVI